MMVSVLTQLLCNVVMWLLSVLALLSEEKLLHVFFLQKPNCAEYK